MNIYSKMYETDRVHPLMSMNVLRLILTYLMYPYTFWPHQGNINIITIHHLEILKKNKDSCYVGRLFGPYHRINLPTSAFLGYKEIRERYLNIKSAVI